MKRKELHEKKKKKKKNEANRKTLARNLGKEFRK